MTLLATDELCLLHANPGHPECPERLVNILDTLRGTGRDQWITHLPGRDATQEELTRVHTPALIERIRRCSAENFQLEDPDTYINEHSYQAAVRAVGCVLEATGAVLGGWDETALCLVRPPGHHACRDRAMGFCLFNNVALAACNSGRRALIIDWDVHHGNGTQDCIQNEENVFFLSIHRWPLYPGTGGIEEQELPNIRNYPIGRIVAREDYLLLFEHAVKDALENFSPELILISCGFDTHRADPIGGMMLESEDYGTLTRTVLQAAPGIPVVSVLEGGYNTDVLGPCILSHLDALEKDFVQPRR